MNAQTFGFSATDSAYARLAGAYDRLQLSLAGNYQDSDFGFRQNTVYGVTFDVRRQVSRRLTAYARAFYRHADTDFDPAVCQANPFLFGFDVNDPLFDPVAACEACLAQPLTDDPHTLEALLDVIRAFFGRDS